MRARPLQPPSADYIADALSLQGWAVVDDFFPPDMTAALRDDLARLDAASRLRAAGVGRDEAGGVREDIRTDRTLWLDGSVPAQQAYLARMETLRLALNEALFLGLFDYECHYAVYPPGGFYKKHIDSLKGSRNRLVSCVTYLTGGWTETDGGHLVLYAPGNENRECARILPRAGTLAVFLSEDIPHEVLPPARERASIAGWYRCNASSGHRADPQK